jgi:hypothetical protein
MLFNGQNKRHIDPRYFLKESVLNEAPTDKQVQKLKSAMQKVFGSNCILGQGSEGHMAYVTIKDSEGTWHNFQPMSGAHTKSQNQPASFRKGAEGAEQSAYVLMQNAEQMERVMMPVIKKIYKLAGESAGKEDTEFATSDVPSALDNQAEVARLKRENEELKEKIAELEAKLSGKEGRKKNEPKKSGGGYSDLEIDQ